MNRIHEGSAAYSRTASPNSPQSGESSPKRSPVDHPKDPTPSPRLPDAETTLTLRSVVLTANSVFSRFNEQFETVAQIDPVALEWEISRINSLTHQDYQKLLYPTFRPPKCHFFKL